MGLKVSTLARLPLDTERDYFVYFLDYGWEDAFSERLYRNFDAFAEGLAGNRGVVIAGLRRQEFADEVFSWHQINGESAEGILPAILISRCHPHEFRERYERNADWRTEDSGARKHDGALLLPLRQICKTPDDVVPVVESILRSIRENQEISDFEIARQMDKPRHAANMFILQPNFQGVGVDLREVWERFKPKSLRDDT